MSSVRVNINWEVWSYLLARYCARTGDFATFGPLHQLESNIYILENLAPNCQPPKTRISWTPTSEKRIGLAMFGRGSEVSICEMSPRFVLCSPIKCWQIFSQFIIWIRAGDGNLMRRINYYFEDIAKSYGFKEKANLLFFTRCLTLPWFDRFERMMFWEYLASSKIANFYFLVFTTTLFFL
jgi:hypothetical protein